MMDRLLGILFGATSVKSAGFGRTLRGLRTNDRKEMLFGFAMIAFALLRDSHPRRELLFSKEVPTGSAIVIHHKRKGDPKIEVIKP